jgi:hypothetical protein
MRELDVQVTSLASTSKQASHPAAVRWCRGKRSPEMKARSVQRPTDLRIIRTAPFMKLSRQRRLCASDYLDAMSRSQLTGFRRKLPHERRSVSPPRLLSDRQPEPNSLCLQFRTHVPAADKERACSDAGPLHLSIVTNAAEVYARACVGPLHALVISAGVRRQRLDATRIDQLEANRGHGFRS